MWQGPTYPLREGDRGFFRTATDVDLIEGNILQILGTRRGERVMLPLFGSRVLDFVHEKLTHTTCALIRFEAIRAIRMWEPRILINKKETVVTPYPSKFMVVANLRYYLKPRSELYSFDVAISRTGGVDRWLD